MVAVDSLAPLTTAHACCTRANTTIPLTDSDPRLRTGQTAEAGVLVADLAAAPTPGIAASVPGARGSWCHPGGVLLACLIIHHCIRS
jgi:hypothetical protein